MKNKEVEVKFGQDIIMTFIQSNSKLTIRTFYTKSNVTIENELLDTEIFSLVEEMVLVLSYFINNDRIYTTITINNNTISCKINDINNITLYQHTVEISKDIVHNTLNLSLNPLIINHNSFIPIYYTLNRVSQKSIVLNKRIVKAKIKIKK